MGARHSRVIPNHGHSGGLSIVSVVQICGGTSFGCEASGALFGQDALQLINNNIPVDYHLGQRSFGISMEEAAGEEVNGGKVSAEEFTPPWRYTCRA